MPCKVCGYPISRNTVSVNYLTYREEYEVCDYCYSYHQLYGTLPWGRR